MDLKAYKAQIKELIPLRNETDFNDLLDKILFGESNSDKFLIKMEMNRLANPCLRVIDLRDKVTEPCKLFKQGNIEHYLTKATIKVLQENIKLYGLYTVGVFEAVHEYIAQQKQKQNSQQQLKSAAPSKKEQCELLALSQKNKRGAARMFYVSEVSITTPDGKKLKAQSSNISATGVKIKFKDDIHLANGSPLAVTFIGLNLEYNESALKTPIQCELIKQEEDIDDYRYFYLSYHEDNKAFSAFISEFIRLNQYKYKIDVQYYYQLAKISALKHAYLTTMNSLALFLDEKATSPFIFALKNSANKKLLDEWHCDGVDHLSFLFNELRFFKLAKQLHQSTVVYSFIHEANGKQYFLCATEEELLDRGLKTLFISIGCTKTSWRIYRLTLSPFTYTPSNNYGVTEQTPDVFKQITHMATLQRLVPSEVFNVKTSLSNSDSSPLNQFVHRPEVDSNSGKIYSLFSSELRKEERYQYSSAVTISDENKQYSGKIVDFSYSGLKVKLNQISSFPAATILTINFTELQKISKTYPLSQLRYKVVRTGAQSVLHLQVFDQRTLDICQKFFSALVKNNPKHFTCMPLLEQKQPLHKQLVEIAEESFLNAVFFVNKMAMRPVISFSAIDLADHPLRTLFSLNSDNKQETNYYPIANNQLYERLVIEPCKENSDSVLKKEAIIYIRALKEDSSHWKISSFLDEDFSSALDKRAFIKESQLNAHFYALHYRLSRLPKMDLNCIKAEIHAISRFAMHLTKKLEEELQAVEGMIEITDITDNVIKALHSK